MTEERNSRRRWWVIGALVVAVAVAVGIWQWTVHRSVTVALTAVTEQTMKNQVFTSGTVRPTERQVVDVSTLPDPFGHFDVSTGEQVKAGQTLITLQNSAQQAALQSAQKAYQNAQNVLSQAKAQYNTALPQVQAQMYPAVVNAENAVSQAKAQLQSAQSAYQGTLITANFAGQVLMENPMGVAPDGSSAPLLELVGPTKQVVVDVSEVDAVHLKAGMKATLTSQAYPNSSWTGRIAAVALYAQSSSSGTAGQVEVDVSTPASFPVPLGYSVNVEIVSQTRAHVPVVPYDALVAQGTGYAVFVYQNGRVREQPVSLGITGGATVEVTKGVSPGALVIANPPPNLRSGEAVRAHD